MVKILAFKFTKINDQFEYIEKVRITSIVLKDPILEQYLVTLRVRSVKDEESIMYVCSDVMDMIIPVKKPCTGDVKYLTCMIDIV